MSIWFIGMSDLEIAAILRLFPRLLRLAALGKQQNSTEVELLQHLDFVIAKVNFWFDNLYPDEQMIIRLRYFENLSFSHIAIECNYRNHSSVIKKDKAILKKIRSLELKTQ